MTIPMVRTHLFDLLRLALDEESPKAFLNEFPTLTAEEWASVYEQADRQTLLGVVFSAVKKLSAEKLPPREILFQWSSEAETLAGLNSLMNREAARLTKLFESRGRRTVVLKGQANARLYPDPLSRQPGDIDIWVDGGKSKVLRLLKDLGFESFSTRFAHHALLQNPENGIAEEIHFYPSSGNFNPVTTKRMLRFLNAELNQNELVDEGFYVPSCKFALIMQLSHIQRHYIGNGVGLRQLVDYYVLLKNSSENDRREIAPLLKSFGLHYIASAVMWLLREILNLSSELQLCEPDEKRGRKLLAEILRTGNFGMHIDGPRKNWLEWWGRRRIRSLKNFFFNPPEIVCAEMTYWVGVIKRMPARIRLRKLSLRDEIW